MPGTGFEANETYNDYVDAYADWYIDVYGADTPLTSEWDETSSLHTTGFEGHS